MRRVCSEDDRRGRAGQRGGCWGAEEDVAGVYDGRGEDDVEGSEEDGAGGELVNCVAVKGWMGEGVNIRSRFVGDVVGHCLLDVLHRCRIWEQTDASTKESRTDQDNVSARSYRSHRTGLDALGRLMTVPEMPEDEFGGDRGSPTNPTVGGGVACPVRLTGRLGQ